MESKETQDCLDHKDRKESMALQVFEASEDRKERGDIKDKRVPVVHLASLALSLRWYTHVGEERSAELEHSWCTVEELQVNTIRIGGEDPTTSVCQIILSTTPSLAMVATLNFMVASMNFLLLVHGQMFLLTMLPVLSARSPVDQHTS